jgi:hypothetical protein
MSSWLTGGGTISRIGGSALSESSMRCRVPREPGQPLLDVVDALGRVASRINRRRDSGDLVDDVLQLRRRNDFNRERTHPKDPHG